MFKESNDEKCPMHFELKKWPQQIGVGSCFVSKRQRRYVGKVLDFNRLTYGPMSQQFEKEFASLHGRKFGVFCNSGTSALRVSIAALREMYHWRDGDEVIIPAVTFVADVNVLLAHRMKPVFVDVHPKWYTIDSSKIERVVSGKTRAIIPVHTFGLPAEMDDIADIAKRRNLKMIEDVCESGLVTYRGRPVGSMSDISCFSTYQAHILTTGIGGLALTDDKNTAVLLRSLVNHGRDGIYIKIEDDQTKSKNKLSEIVDRRFRFIRPGYSFRATELEAALGLGALHDGMDAVIAKRNKNASLLISMLKKYEPHLQLPSWPPYSIHAFMMFPIVVTSQKIARKELVNFLECHNIETRFMLPLINQPYLKSMFGDVSKKYPVSHAINENGFYIGCHDNLTVKELEYVISVFDNFFTQKKLL